MAKAVWRAQYLRPLTLICVVAILALWVIALFAGDGMFFKIFGPLFVVILLAGGYWGMLRQLRSAIPAGTVWETEFTSSTLIQRTPIGSSELRRQSMEQIRKVADCVVFKLKGRRAYAVLPQELFPDNELSAWQISTP